MQCHVKESPGDMCTWRMPTTAQAAKHPSYPIIGQRQTRYWIMGSGYASISYEHCGCHKLSNIARPVKKGRCMLASTWLDVESMLAPRACVAAIEE